MAEQEQEPRKRATYLQISDWNNLDDWCSHVARMFDSYPMHVGSSLQRSDYRDVDIRLMLPDDVFDQMFPGQKDNPHHLLPRLRYLNVAMSIWGQKVTGLPIEFQFQRTSDANQEFGGKPRHAVGMHPALDRYYKEKEAN